MGKKSIEQYDHIRGTVYASYMLDKVKRKESISLLNIDSFNNPFDYKLNIANGLETKRNSSRSCGNI